MGKYRAIQEQQEKYKKWPKVAIIILNYNGWKDTIECLESILRNDYPNYQVIVVDNGSQDNSMEYIKAWAEGRQEVLTPEPIHPLYHLSHPPIKKPIPYIYYTREEAEKGGDFELEEKLTKEWQEQRKSNNKELISTSPYPLILIQTGENLGFAGGNNVGIRYVLAKNDFDSIVLLNNDTVICKNSITELMKAKNNLDNKALYGGRIYYYSNPSKIWYDGGYFNEWLGRSIHINMGKSDIPEKATHEVNFVTFCYVLIPKQLLKEIGLLDESYFMYVEDLDYSYRVWKSGYKLYHVSSSSIYHKVGASSGEEVSEFSAYWYYRNSLNFRLNKLTGIYKISSLLYYFLRLPYLILKWSFKKPKIIKSLLNGIKDAIYRI